MRTFPHILRRAWRLFYGLDGCEKVFFILAGLQAGVIWLHRSFPTQDGPMQIYMADVLEDLVRKAGAYSSYFQFQGYFHPYSFSLYALMLLNQLFPPLASERILVCLYFVAFSLGARFLVRTINAENHWLPLFLIPFAFNTYLCLGIYNYSSGIAILMFMMGIWLRWSGGWSVTRSLLWLALLMLFASMHPVPVGILGLFIGIHFVATTILSVCSSLEATTAGRLRTAWRRIRWDLANAALLIAPVAWYAIFVVTAVGGASTASAVQATWVDRVRDLVGMLPLSPYLASGYRFCLLMAVAVPAALFVIRPAGASFAAKAPFSASLALLITAMTCLAAYVFGPHFLFSAGYFAERMAVPFVICCVAALAPLQITVALQRIAAGFVACLLLFMLSVREGHTANIVAELAPLYDAKPMNRGSSGAIISGTEPLDGLTFNPYFWAGALYARQGKGILLNSWKYGSMSLFAPKEAHPWDGTSPQRIREILLDGHVVVSPQLAFLCGGKWDPARAEMEPSSTLAHRRGLTPVLDSNVIYCYGRGNNPPLDQAQTEGVRQLVSGP